MEDRTFDLLTKMYSEMNEMKAEIKENTSTLLKFEHKTSQKLDVLFDGYVQHTQQILRLDKKVDYLTDRIEHQEVKLKVIQG